MKHPTNPYLDKIASMVEERDTTRAMVVFVRSLRNSADSLEAVARKLGVEEITEEKLPFEGGIFRENGRVVVKLNCDSSTVRKKFTLAHEIGHLFLETIPSLRSKRRSDVALERVCDSIAAELLMPAEEAVPFIKALGSPCPHKLRVIASKFGVSLQVAAIRVRDDFKLWKCCIGLWEWQATVHTMWFVGERLWGVAKPDSYSLQLAIDSTEPVRTTELWARGGFTEQVWLNLLNTGSNRVSGANRVLGLVGFVQ